MSVGGGGMAVVPTRQGTPRGCRGGYDGERGRMGGRQSLNYGLDATYGERMGGGKGGMSH